MVSEKYTAIWRLITSKSATVITQKHPDCHINIISYGEGSIKDMMLTATEIKKTYNGLIDTISTAATESGELHTLQQMKEAIATMEKI